RRFHEPILRRSKAGVAKIRFAGKMLGAVTAHLDAHMAEALFDLRAHAVFDLLEVRATGVAIAIDGEPALPAQQLINGHAGALAFDVPQRHVQSAERIVEHWAVA